jgi:pimeloyl-ACP methyl ester carboxylesterase
MSRTVPPDHPAFAALPCQMVTLSAGLRAAVHVAGRLSSGHVPLICIPGYQRNMSDFTDLAGYFQRMGGGEWPVVLLDLPGRGRADDRRKIGDYSSVADAGDLAAVVTALGLDRAVFLGQGHGGQVAMVLAAQHPLLVAGTVLVDSGPVIDSRGIVRLRNNLEHIDKLRGKAVQAGFRRILGGDYPGLPDDQMALLMARSHYVDKRGRARPLFDQRLIAAWTGINFDDVLTPQWPLFDALTCAPLMLMRTQLTDQLHRQTFDEMVRRRPDATALTLAGQGSPALFNDREEIEAVAKFVIAANRNRAKAA